MRPGSGHKTGFYLDQADNRARVAPGRGPARLLDVFAYTGAFACHALRAGAARAVCVESSPDAGAAARRNFELNGFAGAGRGAARSTRSTSCAGSSAPASASIWSCSIPRPSPAAGRALAAALRGYKEINLRALRLL